MPACTLVSAMGCTFLFHPAYSLDQVTNSLCYMGSILRIAECVLTGYKIAMSFAAIFST